MYRVEMEMKRLRKGIRKLLAGILAAACVVTMTVPAMAEDAKPQVFVNFICGGNTSGKYVPAGSNVTAPQVPVVGGYTFCGFDKSLKNVTQNTTFNAVYVPTSLGEEAIKAKKASLPTPAVSATSVADPNAAAPAAPAANNTAYMSLLQAQQAAAAVAAGNGAAAATNAAATAANAAAQLAPAVNAAAAQAAPAVNAAAAQLAPAVNAAAAQAAPAVNAAAAQAAPAVNAAANAAANAVQAAPAAPAATPAGLPSWAVSLHGVSASGCAEVYKYWKTVKNADDATIQGNWDALLNHYAGHGTSGW